MIDGIVTIFTASFSILRSRAYLALEGGNDVEAEGVVLDDSQQFNLFGGHSAYTVRFEGFSRIHFHFVCCQHPLLGQDFQSQCLDWLTGLSLVSYVIDQKRLFQTILYIYQFTRRH